MAATGSSASALGHLHRCCCKLRHLGRSIAVITQQNVRNVRFISNSATAREEMGEGTGEEEFRVLVIPGHTKVEERKVVRRSYFKPVAPPRYKSMPTEQDWTSVWPAASSFKWSVVPFPVRQGFIEKNENGGITPSKYANAELMKIPNFLHLTPLHIQQQCAELRKFCTPWPSGLVTETDCSHHFPITTTTSDYVLDGPSLRDRRARIVTLKIKMSSLNLDDHGLDKMRRLLGDRYDSSSDTITITTDRCPTRKQNYDYSVYLLTALYFESWKTEPWEAEKTEAEMERYVWDITASKPAVVQTVLKLKEQASEDKDQTPEYISRLPESADESSVTEIPEVQAYRDAITDLHDMGEDLHTLNEYKQAAVNLLLNVPKGTR